MQAVISSSRRHPRRLGVLAVAMLLLAGTLLAGALRHPGSAGAATVVSCGQTVTASVTLTNDLHCDGGPGIVVGKAGITINLGGHTITGLGTGDSAGVDNRNDSQQGFANVTVTNGTITDFETGVSSAGAGTKISKLRIFHTHTGIDTSEKSTISTNTIWDDQIGIFTHAAGTTVSSNVVNQSSVYGILLSSGGTVSANKVSNNGTGIIVGETDDPSTLLSNVASGNDGDGINTLSNASAVNGNVANYNGGYGIRAAGGATQDGKNTAKGNTNARQCENIACL